MRAVVYLRIASVVTLVHALLHTVGGVFGRIEPGPQQAAVDAMRANTFPMMGVIRSFWIFYRGFGLGITIFLLAAAVVMWQLSTLAKSESHRLRPIYWTLLVAFVAMAVNSYLCFFWAPVAVELIIAICMAGAIVTSREAPVR
jgi:hypothetical protein